MTPMMQKFLQKRFEEQSIVFSYNLLRERVQFEHHGYKGFVSVPFKFCSECGIKSQPCICGE